MGKKKNKRVYELITHEKPRSMFSEAYRSLRTNLGFTEIDQKCRTLLLSSPNPMDGKSLTTANLAVVLAQAGHTVVLVDCDLRKPSQHTIFELENHRGVSNCLAQNLDISKVTQPSPVDNLSIISSGPIPPNPTEMLNSDATRGFLARLQEEYDYVLVDGPPVLAVADASILARQVDGVILVLRSASSRVDASKEAKEQLKRAGANLIGVVLNQVDIKRNNYYHNQYYYYVEDSGKKKKA
ncbi:MAG: CpsD/CapB family tyrosine-protein kinase [Syntrophomonadaceae bacterium]|jgi:capsular exopolysaccharide synthesis family protein|nr:CpsD/CapB family tyrosine-protein kinase [Syntrophomonadaceae bacterium]